MAKTRLEIEQEDGTTLVFKKERIKARWVREVFKLEKELGELGEKGNFAEALDRKIEFVVSLFNDPKLTTDVIYDGIESEKIGTELDRIIKDVVTEPKSDQLGKS